MTVCLNPRYTDALTTTYDVKSLWPLATVPRTNKSHGEVALTSIALVESALHVVRVASAVVPHDKQAYHARRISCEQEQDLDMTCKLHFAGPRSPFRLDPRSHFSCF